MDLKKLISSRRGHKGHVSKLLTGTEEILARLYQAQEADPKSRLTPHDAVLLADLSKQLQLKASLFEELDAKILDATEDDEKIEEAVFESADLQASLSAKIALLTHTLATSSPLESPAVTTRTDKETSAPPPSNSLASISSPETQQQNPEPQSDDHVDHVSVTSYNVVHQPAADPSNTNPSASRVQSPEPREHNLDRQFAVRLPKLELPVFTGEPLEWYPFWDCFETAIHSNPSLSNVQKLSYLRAQVKGEAARVIAGLPLTNLNYNNSVTLLKDRYGQPQRIISTHIQALLDLPKPLNKLTSLRLFHDTVQSHVRCLESLGKSPESLDTLLVQTVLTKLPEETKRNMARNQQNTDWTIAELQAALRNEIRIFEAGQESSYTSQNNLSPTASFLTPTTRSKPHPRKEAGSKLCCVYCKGNHTALNCDTYKDVPSRLDIIKQQRLCYNCLAHHRVSNCGSKNRCRKCGNKHHTSICSGNPSKATSNSAPTTQNTTLVEPPAPPTSNTTATTSTASFTTLAPTRHSTCLLKTAIATVVGAGSQTEANVLFDEGSQRSFLTEKLVSELALIPDRCENISLSSFGADKPLYKQMDVVLLQIRTASGELVPLTALVVPTIATPISNPLDTNVLQLPHLQGLPLAHPVTAAENFEISLLIGADYYWELVGDHIVRGSGPTAMSSKLGYLLSGPVLHPRPSSGSINALHVSTEHNQEEHNLLRFWQVEDTVTTPADQGKSDQQFLQSYCNTHITRQSDGTYSAGFPWKAEHPPLPDNYEVCQKCTRSLAYRLGKSPGLLQSYDKILKEQLGRGFIERVTECNKGEAAYYIPHHPVKKNSTTTPIRIVYDCSCRQSSDCPSLNDCLISGPPFLIDLSAIILRFRTHCYGLSTDIEKAFLQVTLKKADRNFTRFLWLSEPLNPNSEFVVYRFRRVLFGAVSSPFMLFATLYYHLQQHSSPLSHNIQANLYVDNIVSGCETEQQAIQYLEEARSLMSSAGFNLRGWASNCKSLNRKTQEVGIANGSHLANILGLQWNITTDHLSLMPKVNITMDQPMITKREVLKDTSKLFDPLGMASPVTVRAKLFMQMLWQLHVDWDEPLDANLQAEWTTIISDINQLSRIPVNRRYFQRPFTREGLQLHVFADASTKAYGAVAFLISGGQTSFVMAKNRVAPLKTLTLPKLELMAAVVASRVARFILDALNQQDTPTYCWGDSQIALYWLKSTRDLPLFVRRRVSEIKEAIPEATWNYCPTADNPADLLTRGISYQLFSLPNNLWWKGPPWLTAPSAWPQWQSEPAIELHAAAAIAQEFTPQPATPTASGLHAVINISDYGTLNRLLAVTAYTYRYLNNLRRSRPKLSGPLTATELSLAQTRWVQACQELVYPKEMASARSDCDRPAAKRPPLVRQLRLFVDDKGLLRCGGRIHNAPLSELARFPYLLPPHHHLTTLIVNSTHVLLSHAGVGATLTALRQSFWIPTGRQCVKKILRRCTICRRHSGRPYAAPEMAPLPRVRVQDVPPFTITGVDFTGALYVKQDRGEEQKVYICLFTCATSRAVHLEVVTDLSTTTFLLAFRRFVARRSLPQVMMSDNATTYTSAAEELRELLSSQEIKTVLGREGVTWRFIPKKAPWFGGYWERLIGLTKMAIKKTLGRAHINLMTLQTIVAEVEMILNDRPLTYVSGDLSDPEPLTPAHLLHGRRLTRLPHELTTVEDLQDPSYQEAEKIKRDAKTQAILLQHFAKRWRHEYLTSLREFHRPSNKGGQQVKIGDVVLVHDDCPRINWKMAVIESVVTGNDGGVRSANIRTRSGVTNRPVTKLYPLEVTDSDDIELIRDETANKDSCDSVPSIRPQRGAAQRARKQIADWVECIQAPPEDVEDY